MASTEKVGVRLSGRFSPGQEVALFERHGTHFDLAHVGTALATAKVGRRGVVEFDGLLLGKAYWVAGEDGDGVWRAAQMTAKARPVARVREGEDEIAAKLAQTRPPASAVRASTSVTGARSTASARVVGGNGQPFVHPQIGKPTPPGQRDSVPAPHARLEDVARGTQLRSHTVTGEAHVVDPDLPDGELRQDQVPADVPQASCTPLGTATIVGEAPVPDPPVEPDPAAPSDPVAPSTPEAEPAPAENPEAPHEPGEASPAGG